MPAHIRNSLLKTDFPYFEHVSTSVFPDPVWFLESEPPKPQLQSSFSVHSVLKSKRNPQETWKKTFSHRLTSWSHLPTDEPLVGGAGWDLRGWRMGGGSRGLAALHSSGWRPAFVSMAGASNPALRKELDSMFGQARARRPLLQHRRTLAVPPPCKTCHPIHICQQSHG